MTSVIGLDLGNSTSKIGLARNRGIDVITNETSNRATPSLISFGPRNRAMGESAKTQETSNYKNTIGSLKRLVGRTLNDPDIQNYEKKFVNATLVDLKGALGVEVSYLGEQQSFTATQLFAMYLGKLRDTAMAESKAAVNDCVIAVPGWFTDIQRQAVLDAAEIAGLNALRLVNDGTAVALGYGITKTDLPPPEEKSRHVVFVDIGHSDYSVTIGAFNKASMSIKGAAYDRHFGGRDLDYALVEHFAEEFKGKYKIDVLSNKKAVFRLYTAVEKLKKILSANISAPLNVESIMEDIDASSTLTREQFEGLVAPLLERTISPLEEALARSGLTKEDIDAVELIGGTTRVPALKNRIQEFFGKPPSITTNQDEAVARGATLVCATLSPIFRVRDFAFSDIQPYPINIVWDKVPEDEDTELEIYKTGNTVPSTKLLTLQRKDVFDLEARYADPSTLPGGINPHIARVTVKGVTPAADGEASTIKIKTRLNANGIFTFDGATLYEAVADAEEETPAVETAPAGDAMDADAAPAPKKSKKTNKKELSIIFGNSGLERSILDGLREQEGNMHATDKLVAETEDRKNALEEYIYDARDKIDGAYSSYMLPEEKEKLKSMLTDAEDWLYSEEGEDATKSAYVEKLDALKQVGGPAAFRYKENEDRPAAIKRLRETISKYSGKATGGEERYSHLTEEDLQKVIEKCATAEKWVNDLTAKQGERAKSQEPAFTSAEALKKREDVSHFCNPIFNKAKPIPPKTSTPKPEEAKPTPPPKDAPKEEQTNGKTDEPMDGEPQISEVPTAGANMDVD